MKLQYLWRDGQTDGKRNSWKGKMLIILNILYYLRDFIDKYCHLNSCKQNLQLKPTEEKHNNDILAPDKGFLNLLVDLKILNQVVEVSKA